MLTNKTGQTNNHTVQNIVRENVSICIYLTTIQMFNLGTQW